MQTTNDLLLDVLGAPSTQFLIPPYQRLYSWKHRQCEELWLDIHRAAKAQSKHFIGTILYSCDADASKGIEHRIVIDGQQRLTTLTLVLLALTRYLEQHPGALPTIDAPTLAGRYLHALPEAGSPAKLVLSRNDRGTLSAILEKKEAPENASENLVENLAFFEQRMAEDAFDAPLLWSGIESLFVIDAEVDAADNAQLIFESLNSKGMPLTTADLVRNYLLLAQDHDEQARLYDEYWGPIEGMFVPDPGSLRLNNAIQGWLSVRFRKVRAKGPDEVYSVFKRYVEDEFDGTAESLLRELRRFCLVWAENYRYHAVKKYRSSFKWATNGPQTLVSDRPVKKSTDAAYAEQVRKDLDATDAAQ